MMAFEPAAESVLDQPGRAVRAFELEAAFPAERHRRIAATVQEQQRLLAAPERLGDRIDENRREPAPALGRICAHVDRGDGGKTGGLVADAKPDMAIAALLGVDQALDRGRGRAQHDGATAERAPHHSHVARLIGDALLLLVALVVLLIDNDEAEIGEGQEQGRARADHELRLVLGNRPPDAAAKRRRHAGMPFGWTRAEPLLATGDELTGQRDLGHQHKHLLAAGERRGDRLEIDFGLARAGHAVEQAHAETVARIGEQLARGFRLLLGQRRPLAREVERDVMPIGQGLGNERAGIDQAVDDAGTDAGGFRQARFDPGEPVVRRRQHAGAGRGHALGRRSGEPHAVARRGRIEGAAGAHHHAQDHAGGGERVARHPVGEGERDARQRRHVVNQFDDLAELLALDLGRLLALGARPDDAEIVHRPERHDDELARRDLHALGHEVVVRRRQRERQHDGHRQRRFGLCRSRLDLCFGQGSLF